MDESGLNKSAGADPEINLTFQNGFVVFWRSPESDA